MDGFEEFENGRNEVYDSLKVMEQELDSRSKQTFVPKDFGLCSVCSCFFYQKTYFDHEKIFCEYYVADNQLLSLKPSRVDPIKSCSGFYPTGQMTLKDMASIAIILDPDKKDRIGF